MRVANIIVQENIFYSAPTFKNKNASLIISRPATFSVRVRKLSLLNVSATPVQALILKPAQLQISKSQNTQGKHNIRHKIYKHETKFVAEDILPA